MQSMNVYGFINGTERMVFAASCYEDAIQLAFESCENAHANGFIPYSPSQEEIKLLMSMANHGTLH